MKINGKSLPPEATFLYMTLTQAALKAREMGFDKTFFVEFTSEIWESMLLSDPEELRKTLTGFMMKDIVDMMKDQ